MVQRDARQALVCPQETEAENVAAVARRLVDATAPVSIRTAPPAPPNSDHTRAARRYRSVPSRPSCPPVPPSRLPRCEASWSTRPVLSMICSSLWCSPSSARSFSPRHQQPYIVLHARTLPRPARAAPNCDYSCTRPGRSGAGLRPLRRPLDDSRPLTHHRSRIPPRV